MGNKINRWVDEIIQEHSSRVTIINKSKGKKTTLECTIELHFPKSAVILPKGEYELHIIELKR